MDEDKKDLITNVYAINGSGLNPAVVLSSVCREVDKLQDIFIVAIPKEGDAMIYSTGDLKLLAYAAEILQVTAHRFIRGEIETDE